MDLCRHTRSVSSHAGSVYKVAKQFHMVIKSQSTLTAGVSRAGHRGERWPPLLPLGILCMGKSHQLELVYSDFSWFLDLSRDGGTQATIFGRPIVFGSHLLDK